MSDSIYLDHASTTPIAPEVLQAMLPYLGDEFGNPASIYGLARGARRALDEARDTVAEVIGSRSSEIVFTSGGTESINLALKGVAFANRARGNHIITSRAEHLAAIHSCEFLEKSGFDVTYVEVDEHGMVPPETLANAIRPTTILVSFMLANNEIGSINPIRTLADIAKARKIPFHTDACQAAGMLDIDVDRLGIDLMSISAHKFYGPKGAGALYVRRGVQYQPQVNGGTQERGRRAGTENVAAIVGLATALRFAYVDLAANAAYFVELRDQLIKEIQGSIENVRLTGHPIERLPNFVSLVIEGIEGESMLLALDARGIFASSGSACTSGTLDPSHVLTAIGLPAELAHGGLRLTTGLTNTPDQIGRVSSELATIVAKLRSFAGARA